jgi:hypothetical protein
MQMSALPSPINVNEWFPLPRQQAYVDAIAGQFGLTRRQATCFVRLWGYATLQTSPKLAPLKTLQRSVGTVVCSHREAADLFYCDQRRGSERSAGMMINQLVARNLVRRDPFDGGPTRLSLNVPESFVPQTAMAQTAVYTESFNGRRDAVRVANLLEASYDWINQRAAATSFNITKGLRHWAREYPAGLRVLKTLATDEVIGFAAFHPTAPESEENFHLPPSYSLHLSTFEGHDPVKIASQGDEECYTVFVRSWQIHPLFWNYGTVCQFLQDGQTTLQTMHTDFPNLCDIYTISIHPDLERLALALGFKPMRADPNSALRWLHLCLDTFLELDIDEALAEFEFSVITKPE